MVELVLILLGARTVRRKWWLVGVAGAAWCGLGVFFFVNALVDEFRMRPVYFAIPLAIDGVLCFVGAFGSVGGVRLLRLGKAAILAALCALILLHPWKGGMIVGFLVGTFLIADGLWRGASAYVVRPAGWRRACVFAAIEVVFGLWSYIPWPTNWEGEVGSDIGTLLVVSGFGACLVALRLRRLGPADPVAKVLTRGWPEASNDEPEDGLAAGEPERPALGSVVVHVWTPTGRLVSIRRSVSRYVAAFDEQGRVSTGHAALEGPQVYISHYPAVEIDRSRADFRKTLRATHDNDVPGVFQPSYDAERADWCASTLQVRIDGLNTTTLARFWNAYRRDTTYNLTDRNCSVAVARALDAGLEGIFAEAARSPAFLMRLLLVPELWVAGFMRERATSMAWTPGLALDYARALSHLVDLPRRLARRDVPRPQPQSR